MDFYIFHISLGNVATQIRCGGMFSNHFITNFPQNAQVKIVENRSKIWTIIVAYFFGLTCTNGPTDELAVAIPRSA